LTLHPLLGRSISCALGLILLLTAAPAAAMTVLEAKCRATLADAFSDVVKYAHKAGPKCHRKRGKGTFPPETDCNDLAVADGLTGGSLADAESRLETRLAAHCKDVPNVLAQFPRCPWPGNLTDDGGATTGIDSFEELSQCLLFHLHDIVERNARDVLGHPDVPLGRDASKCHSQIAKHLEQIPRRIYRYRSECQLLTDDEDGPITYACASYDADGSIAKSVEKAAFSIASRCEAYAGEVDSCATTAAGIADCAIRERAVTTGGGLVAMVFELPGTCPGGIRLRFDYDLESNQADTGWSGLNHDAVTIGNFDAAQYAVTCDGDCVNCSGSSPVVPADHCRCDGDASVQCADDGDCSGSGDHCTCFFAPPTHVRASSTPYCTLSAIEAPMTGSVDLTTGAASLDLGLRQRIGFGTCPTCVAGFCDGGARDGLSCKPDSHEETFGSTSFDCPPGVGSNLTGSGVSVGVSLSTAPVSLGFHLPCDAPFEGASCACSTCSLDNGIACNSDAECASAAAGICRTDGLHGGVARRPNSCSDQVCAPDPSSIGEGTCANDPDDLYCDGMLQADGRGMFWCETDADCDGWDPLCTNLDCGTCSLAQARNCFLDPIEASPADTGTMVATGCMPSTLKSTLNAAYGIPGPYRLRQEVTLHRPMCADGVTPFDAPGGSSCP
jgi:hypothetical protein